MPSVPIFGPAITRILTLAESMARLEALLHVRGLQGRPVTSKAFAMACNVSPLAAELHLAKLCARGLLAVDIGTELQYRYHPLRPEVRAAIDEVGQLVATQRAALIAWFATAGRRRVLIAEDDADMRDILRCYLEARGFEVRALPLGREALACGEAETLVLALVDLRPAMAPGLQLTRVLRERPDPVRTIVTTSFGDARLHDRIAGLGVDAVLEKPFELDDIGRLLDGPP